MTIKTDHQMKRRRRIDQTNKSLKPRKTTCTAVVRSVDRIKKSATCTIYCLLLLPKDVIKHKYYTL